MIDLLIADPRISQGQLAKEFGYTQAWISRAMNSDAFQARLAERKMDLVDPFLKQSFEDRLKGLANTSLDIVQEKLDNSRNGDLALKTLELTTKALGFGARDRGGPQIQQTFVVALPPKSENQEQWATEARKAVDVHLKSAPVPAPDA